MNAMCDMSQFVVVVPVTNESSAILAENCFQHVLMKFGLCHLVVIDDGTPFKGAHAVHNHMTNTRLTDPEILEMRYPVVLEEFSIRKGSGGKGAYPGGDGIRRVMRFQEDMTCAILGSHRKRPPSGLNGGGNGEVGKTEIRRLNGEIEELKHCDQTEVVAGEAVIVVTPSVFLSVLATPLSSVLLPMVAISLLALSQVT